MYACVCHATTACWLPVTTETPFISCSFAWLFSRKTFVLPWISLLSVYIFFFIIIYLLIYQYFFSVLVTEPAVSVFLYDNITSITQSQFILFDVFFFSFSASISSVSAARHVSGRITKHGWGRSCVKLFSCLPLQCPRSFDCHTVITEQLQYLCGGKIKTDIMTVKINNK